MRGVRGALRCRRAHIGAAMGRLEPIEDGNRCILNGTTNNPAMYAGERLAGVPYPFVVHGGPELRDAVAALAERLRRAVESGQ